jgi:signal transduction histidine kinase
MKIYRTVLALAAFAFFEDSGGLWAQKGNEKVLNRIMQLDSTVDALSKNKPKEALLYSDMQISLSKSYGNDSLLCAAYLSKSELYSTLGAFDLSLNLGYQALKIAESINNNFLKKTAAYGIAFQYQGLQDVEKSTAFYQKSKQYAVMAGIPEDTIMANYEIGFNYYMTGNREVGMKIMLENFDKAKEIGNEEAIVFGIDNIANLYFESGEFDKGIAIEYELFNYQHLWNNNFYKAGIYEHFAEFYVAKQQWDSAQKYVNLSFHYSGLIESNNWLYECYRLQSQIDEGLGKFKSALENHKIHVQLKDSVYKAEYKEKISAMAAVYELEKKQEHIAFLEKENDLNQEIIQKQRLQIAAVSGLALFLFIVTGLIYSLISQKKAKKMLRAFSSQLIRNQEEERNRIAKELHDSIGQYLLFIKNKIQKLGTESEISSLKSYVDEAIQEVRAISKDLYPNQLEKYGLEAAIESLCAKISDSSTFFVSADLEGIDSKIEKSQSISIYRIIQECINNAMKHSKAESMRIISKFEKGYLSLSIMDNGVGFDRTTLDNKKLTSFGLINIEERVKLLGGYFLIDSAPGKGTKINIKIPSYHYEI